MWPANLAAMFLSLKDKIFFFGAFDPTLNQSINQAPMGAPLNAHGPYAYSSTAMSWAGKLTYQPFANTQFEASTFGDPTHHNPIPGPTPNAGLAARNAASVGVRYNYGSRDSVARVSTAISPTWTAIASYTYNFNHFDETRRGECLPDIGPHNHTICRLLRGRLRAHQERRLQHQPRNGKNISPFRPARHRIGLLLRTHQLPRYPCPHRPAISHSWRNCGRNRSESSMGIHSSAVGQLTNATFRLFNADASCTYCTKYKGNPVYLQQIRGTYKGLSVNATSALSRGLGKRQLPDESLRQRRCRPPLGGAVVRRLPHEVSLQRQLVSSCGREHPAIRQPEHQGLLQLRPLPIGSASGCRHSAVGQRTRRFVLLHSTGGLERQCRA